MEYAFLSHESAVEVNLALARREGFEPLDDEGVWMIPSPESCVTTQRGFKELASAIDLDAWGVRTTPVHLLAPTASSRSRGKRALFHVWRDTFPERAFIRIHERLFVSSPLFTVLQLALAPRPSSLTRDKARQVAEEESRIRHELGLEGEAPTIEGLLAWEGIAHEVRAMQVLSTFAGTYRPPTRPEEDVVYGVAPLLSCSALASFLDAQPSMRGSKKGYVVSACAFDRSGSPMETALALILTLPVGMGGYGLPRPALNWSVPIGPAERRLTSQDEIIADLCWQDQRLVVEYDGWESHGGLGPQKLARDRARANSLTALGWNVLTVGHNQVASAQDMTLLARQVASLLGHELDEPTDEQRILRARLHAQLMPRAQSTHEGRAVPHSRR